MDIKPALVTIEPYEEPKPVSIPGNVPAFLMKLWKLVEDKQLDTVISWSKNGQTFKVHDQIAFAKDVLPKYYKHSNFSSFVRQVNMYGFRKIVDPTSGSLKHEKDEWEFFHQNFQQGKPDLLHQIKRKAASKDPDGKTAQMNALFGEVERLKLDHDGVALKLDNVRTENEMLWREVGDLRQQHKDQQTVINKLIQVFVKIVMTNKKDIPRGSKRRALDYPAIDTKFQRTSQEVMPYNSSNPMNQYASLPPDTIYSVESPESPFRLTEIPDDEAITLMDEAPVTYSQETLTTSYQPTTVESIIQPNAGTDMPFVVKNDEKTITILPSVRNAKTNKKSSALETQINHLRQKADTHIDDGSQGFAFPEHYVERTTQPQSLANNKCLNMDPSQLSFDCIKDANDAIIEEICTGTREPPQNVLLTPDSLLPPKLKVPRVMSLVPTNTEPMTTPVVQIPPSLQTRPNYTRQESFRDRQEISDNVEKINRSIEALHEMLENQPVNLDLKSLNFMTDILPEHLSVQDIAKVIESGGPSGGLNAITGAETNGVEEPVERPMSPSEYIDPQYGISNSDFFDSVLIDDNSTHAISTNNLE